MKRRHKLRKQSKQPISRLQRKIWQLIKIIVRKRYPNKCYTCDQTGLSSSNLHSGHLWPKAALGAYLKYDLRVIRVQCFRCNIHLGGNGAVFYQRMLKEIGPKEMEKLEKDRQVMVNAYEHYTKILAEYENLSTVPEK